MEKAMAGPFGFTYPTRTGTPQSQNVMNDGEWDAGWQSKLSAVPQYISSGGSGPQWTNVSAMSNDAAASFLNNTGGGYGYEWRDTGMLDPIGQASRDFYVMTDKGTPSVSMLNPEWEKLNNQYMGEKQGRQENQTAQQQAYNNMLGNYQQNGVIGADYTTPNFGLVTGNSDTGMPQGTDATWSTGVYDPTKQSGTYSNPNMVNKTFWGL